MAEGAGGCREALTVFAPAVGALRPHVAGACGLFPAPLAQRRPDRPHGLRRRRHAAQAEGAQVPRPAQAGLNAPAGQGAGFAVPPNSGPGLPSARLAPAAQVEHAVGATHLAQLRDAADEGGSVGRPAAQVVADRGVKARRLDRHVGTPHIFAVGSFAWAEVALRRSGAGAYRHVTEQAGSAPRRRIGGEGRSPLFA